ncbi:MAG: tRNA (adenosine(37)-N6)-dimethylallyltransferase MiaA [Methylotetracoccus sp.]|nr:tRNA (adenosine(37)-N6)-dimethylallyltransferase MiaA [Methylotetracoccus sp.]
MTGTSLPAVVALMGPTASGKTSLGVQLAQALNGEVISVDSSLVYRGMDIGTAKPGIEERAGVPHHLIDILDPSEAFSTGQFRSRALRLISEISSRGRLPLLVGGTMLYFNALLCGLADLPAADPELRREIDREAERLGWKHLHDELARVDPQAAARVHPNDPQRIQRALEVYRLTGIPLTELCRRAGYQPLPFRVTKLVLTPADRPALHRRIRERFLAMLNHGLIEEVELLFRRGDLDETLPAIRAVGYRQVWSYLKGEYDRATMIERSVIATRQFAKRQFTWLRRERDAIGLRTEDEALFENAVCQVAEFISAE